MDRCYSSYEKCLGFTFFSKSYADYCGGYFGDLNNSNSNNSKGVDKH